MSVGRDALNYLLKWGWELAYSGWNHSLGRKGSTV